MTRTEMARRRHRMSRKIHEIVAQRRFDATIYPIAPTEPEVGAPAEARSAR